MTPLTTSSALSLEEGRPASRLDRRTLLRGAAAAGGLAAASLLVPSLAARAEPNTPVSRARAIERAMFWVEDPRPYSMQGSSAGIDGLQWRRDCSGFACMAWNYRHPDNPQGAYTGFLPEVLEPVAKADLRPADCLLITPADNGQSYGHVVLFNGWADDAKTRFHALEQVGSPYNETTSRIVDYPYDSSNASSYKAYTFPDLTG